MSFVSYEYLLLLLPLTLITYFLLNKYEKYNISKIILIVASLAFYAFGGWLCLALLIASILVNYFIANRTAVAKDEVRGKTLFVTGLVFNIALLFVFKYDNFFSNAINDLGCSLPSLNLLLPLGISFYTFKQISFLVDAKNSGGGITSII